jgi:hypothetical protein
MNNIFIPKEDDRIPDSWGITIIYYDKTEERFEIVSHNMSNGVFSFWTKTDEHKWRMQDKIKSIDFDKNFSQYIAAKDDTLKK